jgi:shikimate dehydrogenase
VNRIDTETKVLGLIGNPVKESLSPELQNRAIAELNLNYRYFAFRVEEGSVADAIHGAKALGLSGLNVTVPHKKRAAELADRLSDPAEKIGAVNTVLFQEDSEIFGDNTDWTGFVESLRHHDFDPENAETLVFGAGGAARGVVYGLLKAGAGKITITNRTFSRAKKLAAEMKGLFSGIEITALPLKEEELLDPVKSADLVVNSTPVGSGGTKGQSIWERKESFHGNQVVYDLIYRPERTKFLEMARNQGAKTINGLDMLILQGLESLKKWTGEEFLTGKLIKVLRRELGGLCKSR